MDRYKQNDINAAESYTVFYNLLQQDSGFGENLPMYTFSVVFPFLITSFNCEKKEKVNEPVYWSKNSKTSLANE